MVLRRISSGLGGTRSRLSARGNPPAEAIPAELSTWRPAEGVRLVSEAVMHIANGNFLLAADLGVPWPDDLAADLETITDKAEVQRSCAVQRRRSTASSCPRTAAWCHGLKTA